MENIDNPFDFFYKLGQEKLISKKLEDTFKTLDNFINKYYPNLYSKVHELLIIDYLNCYYIKPGSWWKETILPKEKNELLREYSKKGLLNIDLNILYKYSLVIPLESKNIIAIYQNNNRNLIILDK